jgi:NAD(P)H-hydrate repair Nnr-like enzyme with NAD(P)H-hydrate dehydratase domain
MKPEDKAALKAGGTTFLLGGLVAATLAHPMSWIAVAYGTYKIGKAARQSAKSRATIVPPKEDDLFI